MPVEGAARGGRVTITETSTETRVVEAAERCMARLGLRRVSMADVAAEAGVSRRSVYAHFGDRARLVDAVLARASLRLVASLEAAVAPAPTLAGQVAEAAVFIGRHLGEATGLRLPSQGDDLEAVLLSIRLDHLVEQWVGFWMPRLAEAEARGELRAGLDRRRAAEWVVRVLLSFAVMPSVAVDLDDPRAVRRFVTDHLVPGLR